MENNKNGATFKDALDLGDYLEHYLTSDEGHQKLENYRDYLIESRVSWDDHWNSVAKPQLC